MRKQRLYKKRLTRCLLEICPEITVSMLRREINFINSIHDGSVKIGEIHINKSNFRNLSEEKGASFIKNLLSRLWMKQLDRQLKKLSKFIILTEEDRKNFSYYLDNTTVIYNPLPFYPEQTSDCTAQEVIAVGRYTQQKGFDLLIEAWRIVAEKHPDWNLRIYGGGDRTEFLALKDKYHLKTLYLEEQTQNIIQKYCESSIFVLSSRYEGFGMVITEAMSCGVPPVSFTCPCGPRDIIHNNEDGLLVENGDIEQLAEKICYLIENDTIRKEMGRMAKINSKRFKIENISKEWEALFNHLLK